MNKPVNKAPSQQLRVGIFFGGKSAEHDVSISSAKNILEALDTSRFTPLLIKIDKNGDWLELNNSFDVIAKIETMPKIDVALPILHGPLGEDGTLQGVFEIADIAYAGPGVLSSAINMDKDVSKRLLKEAGIAVAPFITLRSHDPRISFDAVSQKLGSPVFVKPANMGSSIGVSKASDEQTFNKAVKTAFEYDQKILVESAISGDEIECSVLGNEAPKASVIGRIIPNTAAFYDYTAKYFDENGAILEIPAAIDLSVAQAAQKTALQAYKILECQGLSRVDMFATKDGTIYVNELNTIPGFTNISMYPKLWEASGLSYTDLITQIIELAIERHAKRSTLRSKP